MGMMIYVGVTEFGGEGESGDICEHKGDFKIRRCNGVQLQFQQSM